MKKAFARNRISLAISLAALLPGSSVLALETRDIQTPQGAPIFKINFYDVGDGVFMFDPEKKDNRSSIWNLNSDQKAKIEAGVKYWATVIKPNAGQLPATINVGTFNEDNAAGTSYPNSEDQSPSITQLQAALTGKSRSPDQYGADGFFLIGKLKFDTQSYQPSQLPRTGAFDLAATASHELAHALGVMTSVADKDGENSDTPYFDKQLSLWESHLRDDNGNPARPNQVVLCTGCDNDYDPDGFDLRKDQGYFTGKNVSDVLAGAMPGLPVRARSADGSVDDDYMSHIELKNSLMSHQNYRNYTTFMEAELAALQDLGYQIDRRDLFGYSVYGDNQTIYNQNGYFQRDPSGTRYLVGSYSQTLLGLGLHVYGSYNQIFQQADLLTRGAGAAGVRVDGEGNTLVVEPGTRIHADGQNGVGVLFAYGKNHEFVQRGDIEALGEGGVAAKFSFGQNLVGSLGEGSEYRGSYFQFKDSRVLPNPLPELMGALVNNVDISGRLAGRSAAILIEDSALVNRINILAGAQLEGGIYSDYNTWNNVEWRYTELNFGLLNDGQGHALDQADPNFRMTYNGDIQGSNNLVLNLRGGETSLGGEQELYAVNVSEGATLSGNSTYTINDNGAFTNRGTVAPGNSFGTLTVDGDYQQTDTGQLLAEVNDKGQHDTLKVNGNASLAGRLSVAPQRGWYSPQWSMSSRQLLTATSTRGAFDQVESLSPSPTLSLLATPQSNGAYLLRFERASDAYSQYATSQNGRAVGEALSRDVPANADSDTRKLYTTLDFSNPDGSTIARALEQLSPSAYSAMMASSLQREQQVADAISAREPGKLRDDEWQTFIQPFGGNSRQNSDHEVVGYTTDSYGVIFGAETAASSDGALIVGLHGAASKQNVSLKDPQRGSGDTSALELGVHARYAADPMAGSYLLGSARVGYESGELKRKIDFDDYSARNKADWTGTSASLVGGGGYRFQLNENVSLGPIATLTYTSLWRDGTHEKGADGSALKLESQQFDSLRSSIGLNSAMNFPLEGGRAIKAEGQVTWNHELLNTDLIQDATFATYQGSSFRSKNTVMDRDSMGVRGNVRYSLSENVDIGAGVASDLFRTGYNSVSGNLSLDWRF